MRPDHERFAVKGHVTLGDLPLAEPADSDRPWSDTVIAGVVKFGAGDDGHLTFCDRPPTSASAINSDHSIVLTDRSCIDRLRRSRPAATLIEVSDPRAAFLDTLQHLVETDRLHRSDLLPREPQVDPAAQIATDVILEEGVHVEAGAVVCAGAVLKSGTCVRRGAFIGERCVLGNDGIHVYVGVDGRRRRFPHLGGVVIGPEVRLGAGCVVPRGILDSTWIGDQTIIGNLCNIGHGVVCGANGWISSGTVLGGQTRIGNGVTIGMGCIVRDNITIGDGASVGMGSVVTKKVGSNKSVFGNPAKRLATINAGPAR